MSQEINVLIDGAIFSAHKHGGILRVYQEVLPRLVEQDENVNIQVVTIGNPTTKPPQQARLSLVTVPDARRMLRPGRLFNGWLTPRCQRTLNRYVAEPSNGRLIWHPTYYSLPWTRRPTRFVITVYDMIHERYPTYFPSQSARELISMKRSCIKEADTVICISKTTAEDVCTMYPTATNKVRVVYIGQPSVGDTVVSTALPEERPFLLYVGGREGYKNFCTLLTAYSRWRHRGEVDLHVVGPEWSVEESKALTDMKCHDNIIHLGQVSDSVLATLYNRATALIYPSLFEGFGLPLVEAMAVGCPIVASRIPSTTEVAAEYPIYFSAESSEELSSALTEVLLRGRSSDLSRLGRTLSTVFSWDETARQTLQVYREY